MALSGRDMRDIYQTLSCRLDDGKKGPPDSFTEEEKKMYLEMEKSVLADRKAGRIVNYDFPNDYDWENGFY